MNLDLYQREQISSRAQQLGDAIGFQNPPWEVENKLQELLQALGFPYVSFETPGHAALFLVASMIRLQMTDGVT